MFIKLTRSGGRSYAQLVESFRDEQGRPRQRTLATLGRSDEVGGQVDALLQGLLRVKGRPPEFDTNLAKSLICIVTDPRRATTTRTFERRGWVS